MKKMIIEGNKKLTGKINISGAKNSAVALIPAALLSNGVVKIDNVPNISDVDALIEILEYLNAKVTLVNGHMEIDTRSVVNKEIPNEISSKLRASYYFMSALLGKYKDVTMYFPGGCSIGARPIDQTLKGYKALGANVIEDKGKFRVTADKLKGNTVYLDMPSVGATINTMLASVKAQGKTIIENAAKEPEIVNVAIFLNSMGANIQGAGTSRIIIKGVDELNDGYVEVIPDRIEAGTYIILGALVGDRLEITNIIPEHIDNLLYKLKEMEADIEILDNSVIVSYKENIKPVNIKTLGYPGFPTDLQQPITVLLTQCNGKSILNETIYENRFKNIPYLQNMNADIKIINNQKIEIQGISKLNANVVEATDLRAGACLVLAALKANGKTIINNVDYVLRGCENIVDKLKNIGAIISIVDE